VTYREGIEPIDIQRLISPLRYDVLVRKNFFELLEREMRLYEHDFDRFMEIATQSPYRLWFDRVYCPRFQPALLLDDAAHEEAYRKRVKSSARLYASFERCGFLPDHKIILRSGREILPAESGKPVSAEIFAGDGCHRLALLLKQGARVLQPGQYVVKVVSRYSPLDNTALLLPGLNLSSPEYTAFISASFSDNCHNRLDDLLDDVAARSPWRLGELKQVISADRLLFPAEAH
jgi:hypothetical protein